MAWQVVIFRRGEFLVSPLAAEIPRARLTGAPRTGLPRETPPVYLLSVGTQGKREEVITMSEEAKKARQALQESMDLRDQGHTDD